MEGSYHQAPSYQTLKKRMDISFPPTLAGGQLLTKQIKIDNNSNMVIPRTLHYLEPIQAAHGSIAMRFLYHATFCMSQVKLTTCGEGIYDKVTSATWFENAFNNSPASENGVLKTGCLFVALAVFSDGSPIDEQMKHSEHPFLLTMLNFVKVLPFV